MKKSWKYVNAFDFVDFIGTIIHTPLPTYTWIYSQIVTEPNNLSKPR
jgi:hypothetical protein